MIPLPLQQKYFLILKLSQNWDVLIDKMKKIFSVIIFVQAESQKLLKLIIRSKVDGLGDN